MTLRSTVTAAAFVALAPSLPAQCNKLLGRTPAEASAEAAPPASATVASSASSAPNEAVTTPPIWNPPEPPAPPPEDPYAEESAAARASFEKKDWKRVRSNLDKKAKAGKATSEEVAMLEEACARLKDRACVSFLMKRYPLDRR